MNTKSKHISSLSPEYALLGFLTEQPHHGYELHQRLENELGHVWHVSQSQVYNILKRLELRRDITGNVQEQDKLPNRLMYKLTPEGRARFEVWMDIPTGCSVRAIRVEFITRLYFAWRRGNSIIDSLIDSQIEEVNRGLVRLRRTLDDMPPEQVFNQLSLELRINQLTSILEWLERCRTAIQRQSQGPP